eukprot:6198658-Pleurochrysis_carterae.AAC.1
MARTPSGHRRVSACTGEHTASSDGGPLPDAGGLPPAQMPLLRGLARTPHAARRRRSCCRIS